MEQEKKSPYTIHNNHGVSFPLSQEELGALVSITYRGAHQILNDPDLNEISVFMEEADLALLINEKLMHLDEEWNKYGQKEESK